MTYLIWAFLSVLLLIVFLILCIRAFRVVREKMGTVIAVFLTIGLLSFMSASNAGKEETVDKKVLLSTLPRDAQDSQWAKTTSIVHIPLEDNFISEYNLVLKFSEEGAKPGVYYPVSGWVQLTGMQINTRWQPGLVMMEEIAPNRYSYEVTGYLSWYLLGLQIMEHSKSWTGEITLPVSEGLD